MNNFNHLLRSKQAAAWLGISLSTFYKYVKQGLIPPRYVSTRKISGLG
ncbi:helix-turn-helix domain-containing protein [Vibrio parahaemolyticus]|nr:helix-turn-helix domain-containing protein [Vibrio parahaemolyticus]